MQSEGKSPRTGSFCNYKCQTIPVVEFYISLQRRSLKCSGSLPNGCVFTLNHRVILEMKLTSTQNSFFHVSGYSLVEVVHVFSWQFCTLNKICLKIYVATYWLFLLCVFLQIAALKHEPASPLELPGLYRCSAAHALEEEPGKDRKGVLRTPQVKTLYFSSGVPSEERRLPTLQR